MKGRGATGVPKRRGGSCHDFGSAGAAATRAPVVRISQAVSAIRYIFGRYGSSLFHIAMTIVAIRGMRDNGHHFPEKGSLQNEAGLRRSSRTTRKPVAVRRSASSAPARPPRARPGPTSASCSMRWGSSSWTDSAARAHGVRSRVRASIWRLDPDGAPARVSCQPTPWPT